MRHVPGDVKHQCCQENYTDAKEDEGEPSPEADIILQPVDILGVAGLQLGELGDVLPLGVCEFLAEFADFRFVLCSLQLCGSQLQICGGKLLADLRGGGGTGMIQRRKANTISADGSQRFVDDGDSRPLIVLDRIGEIFIDGGIADLRCGRSKLL